ncbi:uncharacterized protein F5147DRAFT_769903 [Suillus discolor]|uniref:CxC2-like cysteine cluster KDZ transposase-associated domain-containing protein n=1 Tax=Suillus discolor TaxID=1912936 RepID=A0A9P7JX57_9AGAM|nr:uncharacterized protein F5147DRAFT_769903 [Suillus discolor]KAG2114595.1 hypothetical protein F5147DRAFT_769903 [Suillus discolor]
MGNVRIAEERRALFVVCPAQESTVGVPHVLSKPTSTIPSTTFNFGMASSTSLLLYETTDISYILAMSDLRAMEDVFGHGEGDTIYDTQLGLSNLVIVHSTGVYSHRVSWCQCPGADKDGHLHLLKAKLFPASITRPQSAFTFDVLDNFLIDALECKTSAMSFYQKLRRFTNNAFPHKIPDRYRELMRVSCIWRDLVNRIRFSFAHELDRSPGPGDLALYCPACPQPGINLPSFWKDTYDSWLVMQRYVIDGNFTAQHMKMKTPEDDVSLADGKGYMKSSCSNHHAVNAVNVQRSNLRATGVGATACARHGCFVPLAVVDFQKGERQMNMDYSICNALKYPSEDIDSALIIYDVACQWSIHFDERVNQSYHLSLPPSIKILPAIGKFHLSAHKLLCFPRFSLDFIKGAGHIDGEILETLWAPFNKISPTARSMTLSHRQEVLDDHMRDSNWKKLVRIGKSPLLTSEMSTSTNGTLQKSNYYLKSIIKPYRANVQKWKKEAELAALDRGELLDIYQLKIDKAPTMAEIRLRLTENESVHQCKVFNIWNVIDSNWVIRDALRSFIRQLPEDPTASQRTLMEEKRQKLLSCINKFHKTALVMTNGMEFEGEEGLHQDDPELCLGEADGSNFPGIEELGEESILDLGDDADSPAEVAELWMPSWGTSDPIMNDVVIQLRQEELELQKG